MSNEELLEQIVKLMETQNGHYVIGVLSLK